MIATLPMFFMKTSTFSKTRSPASGCTLGFTVTSIVGSCVRSTVKFV